jgi:hypothetical protein
MKKSLLNISGKIVLLLLITGIVSCKKFLDITPSDQVTDGTVWSNTTNADLFLNQVYAGLGLHSNLINAQFNNTDPDEDKTDNEQAKPTYTSTIGYKKSAYTPASPGQQNLWGYYNYIRKANMFIEKVTASTLPDSYKKLRIAEARFLRAYYYMYLWTYYGGVPIITIVLNITEQGDAVFQPRNSDAETVKFITDECAAIANDLPNSQGNGRVTKGAALTLKGWVELFNAGALKNPANDKAKWALAAATNKQVMDLGTYRLFANYETMLYEANEKNPEVIFAREHVAGSAGISSSKEGYWGPFKLCGTQVSSCGNQPTQEMVDAYRMSNGKVITDPTSGYDPQNPYVNREKRFYSSILYDGSVWAGCPMIMKQGVGSENATDIGNTSDATNTGYYFRKGLEEKNQVGGENRLSGADYQIFRYAEVLLAYAEAQNEAVGPDQTVYDALNLVRVRGGIPGLTFGSLTQAEMRTAIAQERRVELYMEMWRHWDLLRSKTAEIFLNGTTHGMRIDLVGGVWKYTVIAAPGGTMLFVPSKNYLYPIPQSAIDRNPKIVQNPGY